MLIGCGCVFITSSTVRSLSSLVLVGQPRPAQVTFGLRLLDLGTVGYIGWTA
jgi:hypothetical protein